MGFVVLLVSFKSGGTDLFVRDGCYVIEDLLGDILENGVFEVGMVYYTFLVFVNYYYLDVIF